jgi:hypothetical protein
MRVTIYDLSVDTPDNVDILLVGPQGQKYILMADVGGVTPIPSTAPVTITFSDFDTDTLPDDGPPDEAPLTTGQFLPTSCEPGQSLFPNIGADPPPAGTQVEPGCDAPRGIGERMYAVFYGSSSGTWRLYVRDDAGQMRPLDTEGVSGGMVAAGWGLEFIAATASDVSISGRVATAGGRGITNANVTVTGGSLMAPVTVVTGRNGGYTVTGLNAGEAYVVTVGSRRFTFQQPSRVISLSENAMNVDFTASQ